MKTMRHTLRNLLLTLLAVPAATSGAQGRQSSGVPAWMSYSGPVAEVHIVLAVNPAWGILVADSLVIEGAGVIRRTITTRGLRDGEPKTESREAQLTLEAFTVLLNEFYAERFFQLDRSYQLGARFMAPLPEGKASVTLSSLIDSGSEELAVRLGSYEKRVSLMPREGLCPSYLLKLRNSVIALSRAHGIYK